MRRKALLIVSVCSLAVACAVYESAAEADSEEDEFAAVSVNLVAENYHKGPKQFDAACRQMKETKLTVSRVKNNDGKPRILHHCKSPGLELALTVTESGQVAASYVVYDGLAYSATKKWLMKLLGAPRRAGETFIFSIEADGVTLEYWLGMMEGKTNLMFIVQTE